MATVPMKYDMVRDGLVGADFIEDPGLDVLMRVEPNGVIRIKGQFIEATRSYDAGYADSPDNYSLIAWWRASDLTATYSESQDVTSWSDFVDSSVSASTYPLYSYPYYTERMAGNTPSVHFFKTDTDALLINKLYDMTGSTLSILFKGNGTDSNIMGNSGGNIQVRRFRSSANNISCYVGVSDVLSGTFSSSISQSAVCTWIWGLGSPLPVSFYEGKYHRGSTSLGLGSSNVPINVIGRTNYGGSETSGSIAEICLWSGSLSTSSLQSLYDNYWKVKYAGENLYTA